MEGSLPNHYAAGQSPSYDERDSTVIGDSASRRSPQPTQRNNFEIDLSASLRGEGIRGSRRRQPPTGADETDASRASSCRPGPRRMTNPLTVCREPFIEAGGRAYVAQSWWLCWSWRSRSG